VCVWCACGVRVVCVWCACVVRVVGVSRRRLTQRGSEDSTKHACLESVSEVSWKCLGSVSERLTAGGEARLRRRALREAAELQRAVRAAADLKWGTCSVNAQTLREAEAAYAAEGLQLGTAACGSSRARRVATTGARVLSGASRAAGQPIGEGRDVGAAERGVRRGLGDQADRRRRRRRAWRRRQRRRRRGGRGGRSGGRGSAAACRRHRRRPALRVRVRRGGRRGRGARGRDGGDGEDVEVPREDTEEERELRGGEEGDQRLPRLLPAAETREQRLSNGGHSPTPSHHLVTLSRASGEQNTVVRCTR